MNISDKNKCIFIHIPKVAGTSIKQVLGMPGSGHYPWQFYSQNFPDKWNSYRSFTVVRNPWDRLVSAFSYACMETSVWHDSVTAPHPDYNLLKGKAFSEFCEILANHREQLSHESWHPQYIWIAGTQAGKIVLAVDEVLHCESLDVEFPALCTSLGIDNAGLPRINTSGHGDYREYYDSRTIAMVERLYADDIRLFNYTF